MDVRDNVVTEKGEHEARDGRTGQRCDREGGSTRREMDVWDNVVTEKGEARGERWTYGTTL